jgi:16S rRNA (adenine1518-N6/adenine1519-N6)-dimethyltransferase
MVLMFQREVAQRFLAEPGTSSYGILSVIGQFYHEIEAVMDVPPNCFEPAPKVMSTVLRFIPRTITQSTEEEARFRAFVHAAFRQRRKTLVNSLNGFEQKDRAAWAEVLQSHGYEPTIRAENLSRKDFLNLIDL